MFEDQNLGPEILANPSLVQSMVLTEYQARLGGQYSVADANNSFNLLLEAASSINAQSVRSMQAAFEAQYPVRATTMADLYNHMSDFDYLNLVAQPTNTTVCLTFDADYLVQNAAIYDATYNRIVIPDGSQFYIGPLTFGIYYPINININVKTNNINVLWDTTSSNPLSTLSTNMVPFIQYQAGGLNLITLYIPVSQFSVATTVYPVVSQQGFIQNFSYTDQFYAARVFTNTGLNGAWTELAYTLSETVYDPTTPTAKLVIQNDVNILTVTIPAIYFTNNQIGNQVQVRLYTTKGAMTLDLTSVELTNCNVNFNLSNPNVSPNAKILSNLATINLTPGQTAITGGSNALTFTQMRALLVGGGLYTAVPVTPAELTAYASKNGFSLTKHIDNVTDRIYYASNNIQGGQNGYVMVTTGSILVTPSQSSQTSTILQFPGENATTILPTTLYTYNAQNGQCLPLTDAQVAVLESYPPAALAANLNATTYTRTPFHLVTYSSSQYPETKSFNLMTPSVSNIQFIADNVHLTPQMSVISATILHNKNGTGGYTLRLGVTKTPAMQAIAESNITILVSTQDLNGQLAYGIATLFGTIGTTSSTTTTLWVYELQIPTTYYISQAGTLRTTLTTQNSGATAVDLSLATTFTVTSLLASSLYPTIPQMTTLSSAPLPPMFLTENLAVSQQTMVVTFGYDLSSQIFNITNVNWSALAYQTYQSIIYQTYPADVYETNAQGGLVYSIVSGAVILTKLHSAGNQVLDALGNPVVLHAIGTFYLDIYGNPIPLPFATRQPQYSVSCMMFDLRLFYSAHQADVAFVAALPTTLSAYLATISTLQSNLLEQTQLYYVPNTTMGSAVFSSGNNKPMTLNLGFSFSIIAYVAQTTLDNATLIASITSDITAIIQNEMTLSLISLTDIAQNIKTQLADTILSVDVNGIDGSQSLQTVIVPVRGITPIVAQTLVYDITTNTTKLQPAITLTYELAA